MPTPRGARKAAEKAAEAIYGLLWSEFCQLTNTGRDAPLDVAFGLCSEHLAKHGNREGVKCCAVASGVMLVADELGQHAGGAPYLALMDGVADVRKALQSLAKRLDGYLSLAQKGHERARLHGGYWHECAEACERPKRIRAQVSGLLDDLDQLRHFLPAHFTALDLSQSPSAKQRPLLLGNLAHTLQVGGYSLREIARLIGWNPDQQGIEDRVAKLLSRHR